MNRLRRILSRVFSLGTSLYMFSCSECGAVYWDSLDLEKRASERKCGRCSGKCPHNDCIVVFQDWQERCNKLRCTKCGQIIYRGMDE